jgi:hypothetical protein
VSFINLEESLVSGSKRVFPIVLFTIFLLLVTLAYLVWQYTAPFTQPPKRDLMAGFLGGILGSLLTLLLAYVAWKQLNDISRTASGDFILRLKGDFFREETGILVQLIVNEWLKFVQEDNEGNTLKDPFFIVDQAAVEKSGLAQEIRGRLLARKAYSAYDIDDLLLGHFEDLAMLWEKGVLDIRMIHDMFSWYVEKVWDDCDVRKYVKSEREETKDIYAGFERLYEERKRIDRTS